MTKPSCNANPLHLPDPARIVQGRILAVKNADWVAHRGCPLRYPENTIVGLRAAFQAGAHWIETDVQLSADGVPVLFHDRRLRRVCGVSGAIHERTSAQLDALRASEPDFFGDRFADTPLATLADLVQLLQEHADGQCFVEIKPVAVDRFGLDRAVAAVVQGISPVRERCVVISFDDRVLPELRRRGVSRTGWIAARWEQVREPPLSVRTADYLFCNAVKVPRSGPLGGGIPLGVYDVIERGVAERFVERGARLVETFAIGEMLDG